MVNNNPDSNGEKPLIARLNGSVGKKVAKDVRNMRQKVIDLKRIMVDSIKPEELFQLMRDSIELALAGNGDAKKWVVDTIIGTPIKSPDLTEVSETQEEDPKVVLLDWRRNGIDTTAESN
jgi:hypothetical protein